MNPLILHHFDASPFAEKIRLALGIKRLAWRSVDIPMILPKPDLMPLTGGYRKTPVLQIGAEIYCDTSLILQVLERRAPEPTLFPEGSRGLALAVASWSDKAFFEPGAALSMALNSEIPEPVLTDRKAFFEFMDFGELETCAPHMLGQFLAQAALVEDLLADGRHYLLGGQVSAVDIMAWFPLWMARANVPGIDRWLENHRRIAEWEGRMRDFGYGERSEMPAADALQIAADSAPSGGDGVADDPSGLRKGDTVNVAPTDYGAVPVTGELITLSARAITLRRRDERVGEVNTHFPRGGYRIDKA